MSLRGIDIRESGAILFRTVLYDTSNLLVPSGNTQIRLYEYQTDGRLFQYDFASNKLTFSSGIPTTASGLMTERKSQIVSDTLTGGQDTGVWTYLLPHSSGFKDGYIYAVRTTNSSASPTDQYREFQWGNGVLATVIGIDDPTISRIVSGVYASASTLADVVSGIYANSLSATDLISGIYANAVTISDVASGVWTSNPDIYNSGFGAQLQPVYFADIKQYYDLANNRDEYSVQWFCGPNAVTSGQLTNPAISVYKTDVGTSVFANQKMDYASTALGSVRYQTTTLLASGEPYLAIASGTIGGSSRSFYKVIGRHSL